MKSKYVESDNEGDDADDYIESSDHNDDEEVQLKVANQVSKNKKGNNKGGGNQKKPHNGQHARPIQQQMNETQM